MPEESSKASITTPKPNCGPEDVLGAKALALGESILQLSGQIASQCAVQKTGPNKEALELPVLSQLILQRGQLLGELTALQVQTLSGPVQDWLRECLQQCQAIDVDNLPQMQQFQAGWTKQLKGLKDTTALMNKYRSGTAPENSTRSENA